MSQIAEAFANNRSAAGRYLNKLSCYAAVYESILAPLKGKTLNLLEIGINHGGSLQLWKEYLGPNVSIIGVDVQDHTFYTEPQITCIQCDQGNLESLRHLKASIPMIDILIDDGSHMNQDQIQTFQMLFPKVAPGGLYIVEDTHTSYREPYGGGYKKPGSFIEYCKDLTNTLNRVEDHAIPFDEVSEMIRSISFYSSMVIFKKAGGDI